jgi:putative flippase GtrA
LTLRDAIARRYFYVWRDRWSFRTAKTHSGQSASYFAVLHNGVSVAQ